MSGRAARGIVERVLIEGTLCLETPAHFGSGDAVGLADMTLLRDPGDGQTPLLPGASVAGALRAFLHQYENGYGKKETPAGRASHLFGQIEGQTSIQSWCLVDDALGWSTGIELRDGVTIDPLTRTAEEKKKYDVELLQAGTTFDLSMELLLNGKDKNRLVEALAVALRGLERGEIGMGARKRRGLGHCRVHEWRVRRYRMTTAEGLIAWLDDDRSGEHVGNDIAKLLGVVPQIPDRRERFRLHATFELDGSLLIRSGSGEAGSPDMVHLRSQRSGKERSILSGTSLAGAVRARALRIANTIHGERAGQDLINSIFGRQIKGSKDKPTGSRVITEEQALDGTRDLVQSRVKIDRFTGGSYPGALFSQQPAFGGAGSKVIVDMTLHQPQDCEIGLLLLVLKDLWTGDLPLGGESGVGRGRLRGDTADLTLIRNEQKKEWRLSRVGEDSSLQIDGAASELERFVQKLHEYGRTA